MGKSARLRVQDVWRIHRLVHDCRDLCDDASLWRRRFAEGASLLVAAGVANTAEWYPAREPGGKHQLVGLIDWGWHNGFDKRAWEELMRAFARESPSLNPMFDPYFAVQAQDNGVCMTRADLVGDSEWYRSRYYRDYHQRIGCGALLYCHVFSFDKDNRYHELSLARAERSADFTLRDRAVIRALHQAIVPLVGGPLATLSDPMPSELSPRQREVLACLLEGDSDKQIANRLGIARFTVNEHLKAIFRHFSVNTRTELLARWVRRGWAKRFAWTFQESAAPHTFGN